MASIRKIKKLRKKFYKSIYDYWITYNKLNEEFTRHIHSSLYPLLPNECISKEQYEWEILKNGLISKNGNDSENGITKCLTNG
jgi:hypothetical protein